MRRMAKIVGLFLGLFLLVGCGGGNDSADVTDGGVGEFPQLALEYIFPNALKNKHFDYFEVQDDRDILTTMLGISYQNALGYFDVGNDAFTTTMYEQDTSYRFESQALDRNETFDALIIHSVNTLTHIETLTIYKRWYGLYIMQKNFCTFNADAQNCKSYLFVTVEGD